MCHQDIGPDPEYLLPHTSDPMNCALKPERESLNLRSPLPTFFLCDFKASVAHLENGYVLRIEIFLISEAIHWYHVTGGFCARITLGEARLNSVPWICLL